MPKTNIRQNVTPYLCINIEIPRIENNKQFSFIDIKKRLLQFMNSHMNLFKCINVNFNKLFNKININLFFPKSGFLSKKKNFS